ncbi:CCR4-NOT transcription complex subunit 3 [Nymphon striatum]|nr:CCR4-NOT transcription complex subunit 3 [Nymphon striatum]
MVAVLKKFHKKGTAASEKGEIERCLKKVTEGVETFDDIWLKVHNAANTNQKEKYEADLKKEIKKLQRLRDQIKTWLASSEIKDKKMLIENRKLIETQMERFKIVERETKTKAYSKEGLGSAQKMDPAQKEKDEITAWLSASIDELNIQVDQMEGEIESLQVVQKKKKSDKDKQERIDDLRKWTDKHRYHIKHLETLMRMLDNSTITVDQIRKVKDDVEYYIACSQDPDFAENEFIYDDLDLDDLNAQNNICNNADHCEKIDGNADDDNSTGISSPTPTSTNSDSPSPSPGLINHSKFNFQDKEDDRKRHRSDDDVITASKSRTVNSNSGFTQQNNKVQPSTPSKNNSSPSSTGSNSSSTTSITSNHSISSPPPIPMSSGTSYSVAVGSTTTTQLSQHSQILHRQSVVNNSDKLVSSEAHLTNSHQIMPPVSSLSSVSTSSNQSQIIPSAPSPSLPLVANSLMSSVFPTSSSVITPSVMGLSHSVVVSNVNCSSSLSSYPGAHTSQSMNTSPNLLMNGPVLPIKAGDSLSSLKSIAQQAVVNAGLEGKLSDERLAPETCLSTGVSIYDANNTVNTTCKLVPATTSPVTQTAATTNEVRVPPLLGVAPLGPLPLSKECIVQIQMMDAAAIHMTHPSDSERLRLYLPRNPLPTPSYYPQTLPHADSLEFFQRLSTETLFFIFYYMEGTKAQYLAAKALKKQSWRFHTKYMMWFQRHEEPKTITDEFEQVIF